MTLEMKEVATRVPIADGQSVTIEPGQPWPSTYRGSQYSLVSDDNFDDPVVKWAHRDLHVYTESDPPDGLRRAMVLAGKTGGYGSFRVTADREVLVKIEADNYPHTDQAPVSTGWIPVYLGRLDGTIDFGTVDLDPTPPTESVAVWPGFPFNHGERWSVTTDGTLAWNWKDYSFASAFDHSDLVETYNRYRPNPGRLYVTEYGHVWINVPNDDISPATRSEIKEAMAAWRTQAETDDDTTTLRLVNRRMVATSQTDSPAEGHLPLHIGHLRRFDDGVVPRPVVDDESYYTVVGQYEQVYG